LLAYIHSFVIQQVGLFRPGQQAKIKHRHNNNPPGQQATKTMR
jgi:hypothetical protein